MVLVVGIAAIAALLGGRDALTSTDPGASAAVAVSPLPTATPSATATATPTPVATPLPDPIIDLRPNDLGQGETMLVWVHQPGATSGSVEMLGRHFPLIVDGDVLWAVVGASLAEPLGPATATITTRGPDGAIASQTDEPFNVVSVQRPVDYLEASPAVTSVLTADAAATEERQRAEQFNVFDVTPRWTGFLKQPVDGIITTEFGQGRSINGGPITNEHTGTDIANAAGTPIHAAAPGRVAWTGAMPIHGNSVIIDHGGGVMTGYHHLQEIKVHVGQQVTTDDVIGLMGSTGFSTGPHLHWELTIYGVNVDAMTWTLHDFTP